MSCRDPPTSAAAHPVPTNGIAIGPCIIGRDVLRDIKINQQLPGRLGQTFAATNEQSSTFDHDRRIGQRPRRIRQHPRQRLQLAIHGRQSCNRHAATAPASAQRELLRNRNTPAAALRVSLAERTAQMPLPNRRDRHADQLGQHRGRIEPLDSGARLDEAQPSPEIRFVQDLHFAAGDSRSQVIVEQIAVRSQPLGIGRFVARHDQDRPARIGAIDQLTAAFANQPLGVAARHARQLADEHHPPAGERGFSLLNGRTAHAGIIRFVQVLKTR